MPTEVIHSIRASGGDYTTLSAWEAAQQRDLVAVDEIAVAEVYDDWPTGLSDRCVLTGWTENNINCIEIRAAAGDGHGGDIGTGALLVTNSSLGFFAGKNGYRLIGLRFRDAVSSGTNGILRAKFILSGNHLHVDKCLFLNDAGGSYYIGESNNDIDIFIINSLFLRGSRGITIKSSTTSALIQNCTFIGNTISAVQKGEITNCLAYGNALDFEIPTSITTSASQDTSGTITGITSAEFENYASDDFHLASTSTLIGAGTDLSSTILDDIDGDPRTVPFDIGFDQYVATGGGGAVLVSDAQAIANATGGLSTAIDLSANAHANSLATAIISTQIPLVSSAVAISTATAAISTAIDLSAQAASISTANGLLTAQIKLKGDALANAIASASLSSGSGLSGNAISQSNANGNITTLITLSGAAIAEAFASAGLTASSSSLSGNANAESFANGVLVTQIPLAGNALVTATMQGGLSTAIPIQANAVSASNVSGGLTTAITLGADAIANALVQGDLTAEQAINLSGSAIAEALSNAELTTEISMSVSAVANAIATGSLSHGLDIIPQIERWTTVANQRDYEHIAPKRNYSVCV